MKARGLEAEGYHGPHSELETSLGYRKLCLKATSLLWPRLCLCLCLCVCNKTPQTGYLISNRHLLLIVLRLGRPSSKCWAGDLLSTENSLLRGGAFSLCPVVERLAISFMRALSQFRCCAALWLKCLDKSRFKGRQGRAYAHVRLQVRVHRGREVKTAGTSDSWLHHLYSREQRERNAQGLPRSLCSALLFLLLHHSDFPVQGMALPAVALKQFPTDMLRG